MKIHVSNVIYKERTKEWQIDINTLRGYQQYKEDPATDKTIWTFGDFASMNAQQITDFYLDVPFTDLTANISEIHDYVLEWLKQRTTREVQSLQIQPAE